MMPNIPLHSMIESSWVVPRDENLESSLFILEEQEKEYNAQLESIAKIEAPEPLGKGSSTMTLANSRIMPSPPNRPRSVRSRRRHSNSGRNSYGYTPTSAGGADSSRRSHHRRHVANSHMSTPGDGFSSPVNSSRIGAGSSPNTSLRGQTVQSTSFEDDANASNDGNESLSV